MASTPNERPPNERAPSERPASERSLSEGRAASKSAAPTMPPQGAGAHFHWNSDGAAPPAITAERIDGLPEGLDALFLAELARAHKPVADADRGGGRILHIARDDRRLAELTQALGFFAPDVAVIALPAWDCVPYDRVSPHAGIVAKRMSALARLAAGKARKPTIVLTTVNAVMQRLVPRAFIKRGIRRLAPGQHADMARLGRWLEAHGYVRTGAVMEAGEYAVRGGILDLFPPGRTKPVRLDFFGDTIETIRQFEPETQRSSGRINRLVVLPVTEVDLSEKARAAFRQRYVALFGPVTGADPLYEAISGGGRAAGMEHWLPLFHDGLETLFDYLGACERPLAVSFDHLAREAILERTRQIAEHYEARSEALEQKAFGAPPYNPVPPEMLFLSEADLAAALEGHVVRELSPYDRERPPIDGAPQGAVGLADSATSPTLGGRPGRRFAQMGEGARIFDEVVNHITALQKAGKRVVVAAWTPGARARLLKLLGEHGLRNTAEVGSWAEACALSMQTAAFAILGLEAGFVTDDFAIIAEQDILGDRFVRPRSERRKAADVLREVASLSVGDLVVHADHGIARFAGLKTIEAAGAPHDCLELVYRGEDRLYLPVENIELLSRYGSDEAGAELDRLGSAAWQARKARLKKRIRDIAAELIAVAAKRQLKRAPVLEVDPGLLAEFSARFPHEETDDQLSALDEVLADLASGRPMDRLICGDVGFGKTELALRAAFVAAMNAKQVAVVVPTTLLARQHTKTFRERFAGYPVRIAQASRLVGAKELAATKAGLADGSIDIVIGTHALLTKSVRFADLGLLIIDEEQHFGVRHKERIKRLREEVHVLTMTATPIPRTLELALSGVREISLITTPPLDRLAVRSYVMPVDPVILREALLRERYRGGQSFYVAPRIADLEEIERFLREVVPELKFAVAHGQLAAGRLDDIMNAFYDGEYDVLVSTAIVESGLDIPRANTLIVHRADRFGLAQLHQLRGRVGRAKARAYAYFTVPPNKRLTEAASKRLKVLRSLDALGAGFRLATHDLDIRGAGNLLGEEQSGHIREVGFELYQSMLEEQVAALRGDGGGEIEEQWSPQISLGAAVLIPEGYVADLQIRLALYRRLSTLSSRAEIDALAEELEDRFGPLPAEVRHLLEVVEIKALCRRANVAKVEAGPKGAVLAFRNNSFANPDALLEHVSKSAGTLRLRPDMTLVKKADWGQIGARIDGARNLVRELAAMAEAARASS